MSVVERHANEGGRESMLKFLTGAMIAALGFAASFGPASAQIGQPGKPFRIIVPWPPGGAADIACRHLQQPLAEVLGQSVVVENKSGASGVVGTEAIMRAPTDGSTIGMVISSHASNTALYSKLPYDAVKDFKPITILVRGANVLGVHPSSPYKSVADLVAAAKAQPGKLVYATSGNGTAQHLGFEHFKLEMGIQIEHIAYRGAGPALNDLVSGQVQIGVLNIAGMLPHVQQGRIRALAVTSPKRSRMAPDIPSVAETVPGFDFTEWFSLIAPAGISDENVQKIYGAVVKAANTPAFQKNMTELGMETDLNTPAEFKELIGREIKKFGDLVKKADIKIE